MIKCDVCGKNSEVKTGWHLSPKKNLHGKKIELDFYSYQCIAEYIEKTMSLMFERLNGQEERLKKIERRLNK